MNTSLRFLSQAVLFAAIGLALSAGASFGQLVSFKANSIYNNAEPNNAAGRIVVYNLPTAASGNIYAGPVDADFNVRASVQGGGSQQVAAYGIIMTVDGTGQVVFTTPNPPVSGTPNNMDPVINATQNAGLSIILGETNVEGFTQNGQSLGVVGVHPTANANTTVTNNDGLFSVPIRVAPGVTGNFNLGLALGGDQFSGFGQTDGTIVTNQAGFNHTSNIIEVRQSRRGDMNGDGNVNAADIGGFIAALNNINTYRTTNPWLQALYISDFDQSGAANAADIGGFIFALNNPGAPSPSAIPEPSTVALLGIGVACLAGAAYRRRRAAK